MRKSQKKTNFGPNFGLFTPNLGLQNFFGEFYIEESLNIVLGYYPMQFKRKLMNQTLKNCKKTNFRPNFGPSAQNLCPKKFFVRFTWTSS